MDIGTQEAAALSRAVEGLGERLQQVGDLPQHTIRFYMCVYIVDDDLILFL